jgi:hypothetical protein
LYHPIPIYNVDGSPNEAGSILEVVDLTLYYRDHSERATFTVTNLGKQNIILGLNWLREHNPEVDWTSGEVKMSRCPNHCRTCTNEAKADRKVHLMQATSMDSCHAGPLPDSDIDLEDVPDLAIDPDGEDNEEPPPADEDILHDNERLLFMVIPCEAEFIRAMSNISQRLAEAFHRNTVPKSFRDAVPMHQHDFKDLFTKSSFDRLPDRKIWDHTIELVLDAKVKGCKVYLITPKEQAEMDEFIHENLQTSRICPSKLPMASPIFFIKKKDGTLWLVQDYRALNTMTIKN